MTPVDTTHCVTTDRAAELLGISLSRLNRLLTAGRVQGAYRIGPPRRGQWLIPLGADGAPVVLKGERGPPGKWTTIQGK
jgi:hypothetical protein